MNEPFSSYPPIDPDHFDLIVVGTGLPGSVIAAAASAAGKAVLHLDPNPFYGSHFASLSISDLTSFLNYHSTPHHQSPTTTATTAGAGHDYTLADLAPRSLYSDVEISTFAPEVLAEHSRRFSLDAAVGPRVLFCADEAIDLVVKSGASNYLEFKSIEASFVCDDGGRLWNVPDSRAAIFKDKTLGLMEKNQLMRFFKLVQQHLEASASDDDRGDSLNSRISAEDLESPFAVFLTKMRLPAKIKSIILYAIAMADYDQSDLEVGANVLKTKDGVERLALYNKSVGRFPNSSGALIYPIYGNGELPQAFCRHAAVKGCIHVLRMPVISLLMDKESGTYKGARLASGQDVFSEQIVLDPTLMVPSTPKPLGETHEGLSPGHVEGKVARGICVLSKSLKQAVSNFLVIYPPRSLYPEQKTSVRALQIASGLAVCPQGMCILYFSALCDDAKQGKNLLRLAMNALLKIPESENPETSSESQNEAEAKPSLLWSTTYIQELTKGFFGHLSYTPMPDGNLNYNDLLDSTIKLFQDIYPGSKFFPETNSPHNAEDEGEISPES